MVPEKHTPPAAEAGGFPDSWRCQGQLDNIKEWWITAETTCLAHEAARGRKWRFRRWNNWITLFLAVVTAVSAALMSVEGQWDWVIFYLTIAMAILTSVSKTVEQTFARPEDIPIHYTAVASLRGYQHELIDLSGRIHSHVFRRQRDLDLQEMHAEVEECGALIEETRRNHTVPESEGQKIEATATYEKKIKDADDQIIRMAQKQTQAQLPHPEKDMVLEKTVGAIR